MSGPWASSENWVDDSAHLQAVLLATRQALEAACEASLTGGTCGVLYDREGPRAHPDVPYGEIHYGSGWWEWTPVKYS